jgi:hypothetical protein
VNPEALRRTMNRGFFDFIQQDPSYASNEKDWYVHLEKTRYFSMDSMLDSPSDLDVSQIIRDEMRKESRDQKSDFDKRFIYFLGVREKIVFDLNKPPRYDLFTNKLNIYVKVGSRKKSVKVFFYILHRETGKSYRPKVSITDRFITFEYDNKLKTTIYVHEFFDLMEKNVDLSTEICYVGYTDQPDKRPLNRNHRGYADMVYRYPSDKYDFFVFFNLFKTSSFSKNEKGISYRVSNAFTNEIDAKLEYETIEKALICYFCGSVQEENLKAEKSLLKNNLKKLFKKSKIKSLCVCFDPENPRDMYKIFSKQVAASVEHVFTCFNDNEEVKFVAGSPFLSDYQMFNPR